jgi:hypothetical protein
MVKTRNKYPSFGRGKLDMLKISSPDGNSLPEEMGYYRTYTCNRILVLLNLSDDKKTIALPTQRLKSYEQDMLGQEVDINEESESITIPAKGYYWFFV